MQSFELTKWDSHGMRVLRFRKWLREMLYHAGGNPLDVPVVRLVAFERPIQHGHKAARPAAAAVTYQLAGVMLAEVEGHGLNYSGPTPAAIKKHATGKGNAGKPLMVAAARERWDRPDLEDEDEADALCILAWALDEIGEV